MQHLIEVHILQNFAPSNLNRDDNGSPKDAIFGGYRRARISSQLLNPTVALRSSYYVPWCCGSAARAYPYCAHHRPISQVQL